MPPSVVHVQERAAAWADRHLLPGTLVLLLTADALVAANWWLSPDSSLTAPAYAVAKQVAPMATWGLLFALAATAATTSVVAAGRTWVSGYLIGPVCGGLWVLWAVLFTLAPIGHSGASYLGAIVSACLAGLHLLAGLAVTHRRPAQQER